MIDVIYESEEDLNQKLMEVILLLSKNLLRRFIIDQSSQDLDFMIYKLVLLLKRVNMKKSIDIAWLQLSTDQLIHRIKTANLQK
jgi:hypothetical protein